MHLMRETLLTSVIAESQFKLCNCYVVGLGDKAIRKLSGGRFCRNATMRFH